ncbi:MAG TPA: SH3 domain-containing protein [Candidatus Acidoferrum sp.]|nr:SH3 domain-containing protein [Candidatus Acidoferrum sp.]
MSRKLWVASALSAGALLLPAGLAAANGAEHSGVAIAPPSALRSTIICRGVSNVPLTADAEQALPLDLVASLSCGQEVSVVSDAEGYTVEVRTPDGKSGYVARLYLGAALPARTASDAPPIEAPVTDTGIARWQFGAPGTDRFYYDGAMVESLTANGVTVQVSLQDTGWKLRANVAIANAGTSPVHFNPASFTLDELTPRLRTLRYQNPNDLGRSRTHQAYSSGASAIAPASAVYINRNPQGRTVIFSAPNFLYDMNQPDQSSVLYEAVLNPHEKASGSVWFERDKNSQQLNLRVFVDNLIFEFPLSFPAQR